MSIETEFESTITNVKNAYQGLDNLGATIPQNKTIENIKSCLDEIYNNLPKTSYAEGSNITLSNTLKGKLDFEDGIVGYGDTKQNSYEGYNLLDINTASTTLEEVTFTKLQTGYTVVTTNEVDSSHYGRLMIETSFIDSNKTYAISCDITCSDTYASGELMLGWVGASQFLRPTPTANTKTHIFGTLSGITTTMFSIASYKPNATMKVENLQIYEGSTDKTYEPYTNGASPNPSYPQDIEVVRGKNEANPENIILGKSLGTSGGLTPVTARATLFENSIKPNTQYHLSIDNNYQIGNLFYYNKDKTYLTVQGSAWGNNKTTITPSNAYYISFATKKIDDATMTESDIENLQIQLEKGSQATSYLPYNTLEIEERGKNKLKINGVTLTSNGVTLTVQDNYLILNGTNNGAESVFQLTNYITPFKTNANTKLKAFQISGTASGSLVNTFFRTYSNWGNQVNVNFTQTAISSYSAELTYNNCMLALAGGTYTDYKIGIMVADNLTSDDIFEPYQEPKTYQLSLGDIELNAIDNYKDELIYDVDEDKVYKNKAINKVSLKTLDWETASVGTNSYGTRILMSSIGKVVTDINIISSHAKGIMFNDRNTYSGTSIYDETNGYVVFRNTSFTSLEDFTTFLNNNNVYAYYVLATATKEEITGTLKDQIKALYNSHSFTGTTIIEIDGQLPLIIKVRALKGE